MHRTRTGQQHPSSPMYRTRTGQQHPPSPRHRMRTGQQYSSSPMYRTSTGQQHPPSPMHRTRRGQHCTKLLCTVVPTDSPSRGGDVAVYVYVFDINQLSLPIPFYSVLVSVSVFMALSTAFHSINSPNNCPLSQSVPSVLFLSYWSFQLFISLSKSPSAQA